MSEIILQKLSKKELDKAQLMYFGGQELSTISSVLHIEPDTLRFYIFGLSGNGTEKNSWYSIKKTMKPTAISLYLQDKIGVLEQTAGVAIEIVNCSLVRLRDAIVSGEADPLTVDEIGKIAKVAVDLDKMYRLESGIATELVEHHGLSIAEAKEVLANDPFANAIPVESVVLPWLEEKSE